MEDYKIKYEIIIRYLKELKKRGYYTTEDISILLKVLDEGEE